MAARGIDDASVARLHMDRWHWKRGSEEDKDSLLTTDAASTISPSSSSVLASSPMSSPSTSSSQSLAGSCSATLQGLSELADLSTNSSSPEQILNSCPLSLPSSTRLPRPSRTGNQGRRKPPVAAVATRRRRLTATAMSLLRQLPSEQLVLPRGFSAEAICHLPGHLDLFSDWRMGADVTLHRRSFWMFLFSSTSLLIMFSFSTGTRWPNLFEL